MSSVLPLLAAWSIGSATVVGLGDVLATVPWPVGVTLVVLSYMLGTFPSAQLAGGWRGVDPTRSGSGNPGATNVLRTAGRRAAVLTLLGDLLKGVGPAALGWVAGGHSLGVACGVAAVLGHVAPVTRRFQGGKGVATGMGAITVVFPWAALAGIATFALAFVATRIAAVGSLAGTLAAYVGVLLYAPPGAELAAMTLCLATIWLRHVDNIRRLVRREEVAPVAAASEGHGPPMP